MRVAGGGGVEKKGVYTSAQTGRGEGGTGQHRAKCPTGDCTCTSVDQNNPPCRLRVLKMTPNDLHPDAT